MFDHRLPALFRFAAVALIVSIVTGCSGKNDHAVISASGTIEATEVDVSSKAIGDVLRLSVDEGDRVSVGDTLAVVDHSTLDMRLRQAKAGRRLAQAQLDLLMNGARSEDVQTARENLKQAEAGLRIARDDASRMAELLKTASVTQKQREDADARYEVALAQYNAARQTLMKVEDIARPEEIQVAEAQVEQAEAALDLARKAVSDCFVISPATGIVTSRPIEVGELVGAGSLISTISKLDTVELVIYVTEIELASVKLGQSAKVTIDGASDREFEGNVVYISPKAEFTPKSIQTEDERVKLVFGVKIRIPNPDGTLKPGMPADALVATD